MSKEEWKNIIAKTGTEAVEWIFSLFDGIRDITLDREKEQQKSWAIRYGIWFFIIMVVAEESVKDQRSRDFMNSTIYSRYLELQATSLWIINCIFSGVYDSAVREMRFVLESIIEAFYIDSIHSDKAFNDRLLELKRNRLRGTPLIKKCSFSNDIEAEIRVLYDELCGFVHPGEGALKQSGHYTDLWRFFKYNLYHQCIMYFDKLLDLVLVIIFYNHPNMLESFLQKGDIREILESLRYKQILKLSVNEEVN